MRIVWSMLALLVLVLIVLGWRNTLAFQPILFLLLLMLLSFSVSLCLWLLRRKVRQDSEAG